MKIYLAGFIHGEKIKECMEWRIKIRDYFYKNPKWHNEICFLDPLNGKEHGTIDKEGLKSSFSPHAIFHRDYKCVCDCDLVIANMNTFGAERGLGGTLCELAWAWDKRKPIIMISEDPRYIHHPFFEYMASMIYATVDKMLEDKAIQQFYMGTVTAGY